MTILFNPINNVILNTFGNHGATTRFSYTVPNNKRAELVYAKARLIESGGAVGVLVAESNIQINGRKVLVAYSLNVANGDRSDILQSIIPLAAGDIVIGQTVNGSAIVTAFNLVAIIKEYT